MKRRTFLQSSAVAATTLATAPLLLGTENKSGSAKPRLGVDGHLYECHHSWGDLPAKFEWQTTHNVAVDSQGHVYITHQGFENKKGIDTTFVFDAKGKFVRSFGREWIGGGHGIDIRKEGNDEFIYLTNTWTPYIKVIKLTTKGEVVWMLGRPPIQEYAKKPDPKDATKTIEPRYSPTNVAFCPNGDVWIGDGYGSHFMLKYTKDGDFKGAFGGAGKADGQFQTPHGNWVDTRDPNNPMLVVCDRANSRLQWFDLDGKFLKAGKPNETVLFPAHIDTHGDLMVVADLHARVSLFGKDNKLIAHLGDDAAWRKTVLDGMKVRRDAKTWQDGKFVHPHDACFDANGNIFVVEWVEGGRITMLKKV
jgi:hypothetical protein